MKYFLAGVIDDPEIGLDPGVKKIRDESYKKYNMISIDQFKKWINGTFSLLYNKKFCNTIVNFSKIWYNNSIR